MTTKAKRIWSIAALVILALALTGAPWIGSTLDSPVKVVGLSAGIALCVWAFWRITKAQGVR